MNTHTVIKTTKRALQPIRTYFDRRFESSLLNHLKCQDSNMFELKNWDNKEVRENIMKCVALQKNAASSVLRDEYRPHPKAQEFVSEDFLDKFLMNGSDVTSVSRDAKFANVIDFRAKQTGKHSIKDKQIAQYRKELVSVVKKNLAHILDDGRNFTLANSGHFLYPPGGYMTWHTNNDMPGWRIYMTYVEEPNRSFFRYRDPNSGKILTSYDTGIDLRMFLVSPKAPLWHAVYSETNRFSFGFKLKRGPLLGRLR